MIFEFVAMKTRSRAVAAVRGQFNRDQQCFNWPNAKHESGRARGSEKSIDRHMCVCTRAQWVVADSVRERQKKQRVRVDHGPPVIDRHARARARYSLWELYFSLDRLRQSDLLACARGVGQVILRPG